MQIRDLLNLNAEFDFWHNLEKILYEIFKYFDFTLSEKNVVIKKSYVLFKFFKINKVGRQQYPFYYMKI